MGDRASDIDPLVSVVIPTYDRPGFLAEAIESVAEQTYDGLELVVVDDCSPKPASFVVAETDTDGLREVKCHRHDENRGANAARNTGIDAISGEYVAFLDDDDRWEPQTVTRMVEALESSGPDVGLVTVGMRIVDGSGDQVGLTLPDVGPNENPIDALVRGSNVGSFSRLMVRYEAIEAAGLPDERFPCWQDWEWEFRLARHTRFTSVREPLVVRRVTDHDQISDGFTERREVAYPLLRERHRETAELRGPDTARAFEAELARTLGAAGLGTGEYLSGLRYLLRSLRYDPFRPTTYLFILLGLGGPVTYEPATRLKRRYRSDVPNV